MFDNYCANYKQDGKYRIDGMVVKVEERWRDVLGINEHDPNWGIAIKFKPEDCITEVTGFTFEMGKTGEFTPVALLKPVDLDGSTVSKASAYNANFIRSNNLNVGSLVSLVKSGDIIPQIINVINDVGEPYNIEVEERCPYCGSPLKVVDNTHIFCTNTECEGIKLKKFINSMDALDVFGCGDAMCETLYYEVSDNPFYYLLCPKDILQYEMSIHGVMNKNMEKFVDELKSKTSITLETVIAMMSYEGMSNGGKTIKEVAKKLAGLDYSFKGLEKSVVSGWEEGETKREEVESIVKELRSNRIEVVYPKVKETTGATSGSTIRITMTGSPKPYGYATKTVFVKHLEEMGYNVEEVDVKKCDILFTDDLSSTTGKMKTASELGKTIKEYGEI
jgi:DNA ligase (NAD+)